MSADTGARDPTRELRAAAAAMTDAELRAAVAAIRGTSKRGRRRMLTEGETRALAALYAEQERRP